MLQFFNNKQISFYLFTLFVLLALVLPSLLQHGMFMDGTQYAIISKNLEEGKGSFWLPFLCETWNKQGQTFFLEHPPLVYFLQSFFFKLFNGSYLSERMYCLLMVVLSSVGIAAIWRLIFVNQNDYKSMSWLPVLLWIITPSVFWSYRNNIHENTLSVFIIASVYFTWQYVFSQKRSVINLIAIGLSIFCATLCKGLPGLFTIVIFILVKFVYSNLSLKQVFVNTFVLIAILIAAYLTIVFTNPTAKASLIFYLKDRVLYRINYNHEVENRFVILFWLLTDLIVSIGLALLIYVALKYKKNWISFSSDVLIKNSVIFFFLLGFIGVVPLTLTHVQRAFYFLPTIPFFAIGISLCLVKPLHELIVKIKINSTKFKIFRSITFGLVISVLVFSLCFMGETSRDKPILNEVHELAKYISSGSKLNVSEKIYYEQWDFQFYLLRYHNIVFDVKNKSLNYLLIPDKESWDTTHYKEATTHLVNYKLLQKLN